MFKRIVFATSGISLLGGIAPALSQPLVPEVYITSLEWSNDASLIAYSVGHLLPPWTERIDEEGLVQVVDQEGNVVFSRGYPYGVEKVELSNNQSMILVLPLVDVWELGSERPVIEGPFDGLGVTSATWSPVADLLLLTGVQGVYVKNPVTGDVPSIFNQRDMPPDSFPVDGHMANSIWSPDGVLAVTSTTFGSIYVWDASSPASTLEAGFTGHHASVQHMVWNAATNLIASGDENGRIWVWNPSNGEAVQELVGHTGAILDLDWRADGGQIISTGLDNTIRVWEWPSGEMSVLEAGELTSAIAYSPFGARLALGGSPNVSASQPQAFEAQSNMAAQIIAGTPIRIIVPDPSPERLQAIAAACNAPPQVVQAITSAAAASDAQAPDAMNALVDTVDALPADAIPPGCAADLVAVAEAIARRP